MKQRVKQILDISIDLFARHGVKGVSLDKIGEKANLARTGLYYYFNSGKEQIIENIIMQFDQTIKINTSSLDNLCSVGVNSEDVFNLFFFKFTDDDSAKCRKINRIIFSDQHYIKEIGQYVTENLYIKREARLKECLDILVCHDKIRPLDTGVTARLMNRLFLAYAMEDSHHYPFKRKTMPVHLQKMQDDFSYIVDLIITRTNQ